MPIVATDRATVNQQAQIGVETTAGTAVAATKILTATDIAPGSKIQIKPYRAGGRKFPYEAVPGKEWTEAKLSGPASYNELAYWLSAFAAATITTHAGGTLSKDWTGTPNLSGNQNTQTYTLEKGDSTRAFKFAYGLLTGIQLDFSRDEVAFSGDMFGQLLTDGITLTSLVEGPTTTIAKQPILGAHTNWYLDTVAGNIGNTQLLNTAKGTFTVAGAYGQWWPMNRANASFGKHIDLAPKVTLKLRMEADSVGMSPLAYMRLGSTCYIQSDSQGPLIETTIPYELKLNYAAVVTNIQPFADEAGVYAIEWEFTIIEDPALAYAWKYVLTNQLTALG